MFMEYNRPEEESGWIGPHKSTNTRSSGRSAFSPSLTLDTGVRVCLPLMQASHFGGEEDRLIVIPSTVCLRAMSTIAPKLQ